MQFGRLDKPESVDFTLPADHPETERVLKKYADEGPFGVYIGCAKWNKNDLKGFYPKGIKDELSYYSTQFNCIELNATFYNLPDWRQVETWKNKTPENFKFFPKLTNSISHYKRLIDVQPLVEQFCDAISVFDNKLGMAFLQLHDNFSPKDFERLNTVLKNFPRAIPLAVEVRNEKWFSDKTTLDKYCDMLEHLNMSNIIVDTAGRRDMLHMRLTGPEAFIRYVGANHTSDISRLDDWVKRIKEWRKQGLKKLYFFVHQNSEVESPLLAAHFIRNINQTFNLSMNIPQKPGDNFQQSLF